MNVKEYISSGIVESYVLGLMTDTERREFESQCTLYPEIAEARKSFEQALERQLLAGAQEPPLHLRQQIEERLATPDLTERTVEREKRARPVVRMAVWKWMAAACIILLAGTVIWALNLDKRYQQAEERNRQLQQQLSQSTVQMQQMKEDESKLLSPGMKIAALKGTAQAPQAQAAIFWDTTSTSRDVYLMINNLPQPPSDKQYQLWALLNGKPISLGVFDMNIRQKPLLLKMQNVQSAQAFAITLEPVGGSQTPSANSMYAMGSL